MFQAKEHDKISLEKKKLNEMEINLSDKEFKIMVIISLGEKYKMWQCQQRENIRNYKVYIIELNNTKTELKNTL